MKSIGHFFATLFHGVQKASQVAQAIEVPVETATAVLFPPAVPLERLAFQLLGNAAATVSDAKGTVDAKGLNLTLDLQLISDIQALLPQFETLAAALKISKPTGPVTAPVK